MEKKDSGILFLKLLMRIMKTGREIRDKIEGLDVCTKPNNCFSLDWPSVHMKTAFS